MKTAFVPALVAAAVCFAGCGQKGPLVLPDAQHAHKKLAVPKPAPGPAPDKTGNPATAPAPQQ